MIILDVAMPDSCLDCPFRDGIYCIAADNADGREIKKKIMPRHRQKWCPIKGTMEGKDYTQNGSAAKNRCGTRLIESVLIRIDTELKRLYWNKYQEEMDSPFENTGNEYHNDVFSVRAFDWTDRDTEEDDEPNFVYKGFRAWWYKYLARGVRYECDCEITSGFLSDMLDDCFAAMRKDFGEENEDNSRG